MIHTRYLVACFLDWLCTRRNVPGVLDDAFEITLGFTPSCPGFRNNWINRWFYRWYWEGRCPMCDGTGSHLEARPPDFKWVEKMCMTCNGNGIDPDLRLL